MCVTDVVRSARTGNALSLYARVHNGHGYGMEMYDDATFLVKAPELNHGIGHIHHILLRAHQHLELGYTAKS